MASTRQMAIRYGSEQLNTNEYLIAEHRDTNVAFLVDPGMVDLGGECHL